MDDSSASSGIDATSPTLSARLRELADYLGAPTAGRLTEEQRALLEDFFGAQRGAPDFGEDPPRL